MLRATMVFATLSLIVGILYSEPVSPGSIQRPQIPGFTPTAQQFTIEDYTAWNKFRVFATAIARPSRLSELSAAYAIPGSDLAWEHLKALTQEFVDRNAMVGGYDTQGEVFYPFVPSNIGSCDNDCWSQALQELQNTNDNHQWYILMLNRTDDHVTDAWREVLLDHSKRWGRTSE